MMNENMKLYQMLRKYIIHAQRIHSKSRKEIYRTQRQINALDDCMRYLNAFHPGSPAFANIIPYISMQLHTILPVKTNSSYQNSLKRLNDIINLSKKIKNESKSACNQSPCK